MFFCIFLFGENAFDRFNISVELSKQRNDTNSTPNYNYLTGGMSIDKSISMGEYGKANISWYAKSSENTDGNNSVNLIFKEAYVDFNIQDIQVILGRAIIDLSTSKMYSINTFLSPITFLLDISDKSLRSYGLDGVSVQGQTNFLDTEWLFYLYKNHYNDSLTSLIHIKNTNRLVSSNLYVGIDRTQDFFISSGFSFTLNESSNLYLETKYKKEKITYVAGFDYEMQNGISMAIERLSKDLENTTPPKNPANMLSYLRDDDYVGGYLRIPYNEASVSSFFGFYNMSDKSRVIVFQNEYTVRDFKVFFDFINNMGSNKNSEFESKVSNIVKLHFSLNIG